MFMVGGSPTPTLCLLSQTVFASFITCSTYLRGIDVCVQVVAIYDCYITVVPNRQSISKVGMCIQIKKVG